MTRREWLIGCLLGGPGLSAASARAAARIRIQELEIFLVRVNRRGDWLLVRVSTDAGITGLGDASHGGRDEDKIGYLKSFFELLRGRSIFEIEAFRLAAQAEILKRGPAAAVPFSALEQCLWDIRGKAFGVPASELLGGRLRSEIRNYANINRSTEDRTPEGFARMAARAVEAGFDAVKLAPFDGMPRRADGAQVEEYMARGIECAAAVRRVIGPDRDLLIDAHNHFDLERGLELARRMEPLKLFWLEEVTPRVPLSNLAAINKAAKMPTAGGESIYGVEGFYPYIAAQAVDIVMPDVKYCGGMLELKKIAALAEGAGVPVSPHGPASPVGNLAAAHVCATMPNFQILEFSFGEVDWRAELVDPPEVLEKGRLMVPDRPGLGVSLNERTLKKHRV